WPGDGGGSRPCLRLRAHRRWACTRAPGTRCFWMARRKSRALDGLGENGRLSIDAKALSPGGIASGCQAGVVGFKMALLTFQNGRRLFVRCRNLNAAKSLFVFFTFRVTASRCLRP